MSARDTWRVQVAQGFYLVVAPSAAAAEKRAKDLGASKIVRVARHVPAPFPAMPAPSSRLQVRAKAAAAARWARKRGAAAPQAS